MENIKIKIKKRIENKDRAKQMRLSFVVININQLNFSIL